MTNGPCTWNTPKVEAAPDPVGLLVQEGATFVTITSVGKDSQAPGDTACSADLIQARGTVRLTRPLGTRRLTHPGVSPGW